MSFFIGIAGPWLLVAVFLVMMHRRSEDPTAGQWRSQPSTFFGGPAIEEAAPSSTTASGHVPAAQAASQSTGSAAAGTVH